MAEGKHRLITRDDFDGLGCAALLREAGVVDEVVFVHPKDMQDGAIPVSENDIIANLPYNKNAHLVFDHHMSEAMRVRVKPENYILDPRALSAARVVYDYYGGRRCFPHKNFFDLMTAVDKGDSARFSSDEILDPGPWELLHLILDPRTGLGRFGSFRLSKADLLRLLADKCREMPVEAILELPDVKERLEIFRGHHGKFRDQLIRCTSVYDNVGLIDLREETTIYAGSRFAIYAMFPEINVSIHVSWGPQEGTTVIAVGKSIVNRTCVASIGELMLNYGGGGHVGAGTCRVHNEEVERVLDEIIHKLTDFG